MVVLGERIDGELPIDRAVEHLLTQRRPAPNPHDSSSSLSGPRNAGISRVVSRSSEIHRKPAHSAAGNSVSFAAPERVSGKPSLPVSRRGCRPGRKSTSDTDMRADGRLRSRRRCVTGGAGRRVKRPHTVIGTAGQQNRPAHNRLGAVGAGPGEFGGIADDLRTGQPHRRGLCEAFASTYGYRRRRCARTA